MIVRCHKARSWPVLIKTYASYRQMPVWSTMVRVPRPDGRLRPRDLTAIRERGRRATTRVQKVLDKFVAACGPAWPRSPQTLIGNQRLFDRLRTQARPGNQILRQFFDALVFERDRYGCYYCGRNAFSFYAQTGKRRSLWLVIDHKDAFKKEHGVYEFDNSITSCWSCNTMKGAIPEQAFLEELDSLVEARRQKRTASGIPDGGRYQPGN